MAMILKLLVILENLGRRDLARAELSAGSAVTLAENRRLSIAVPTSCITAYAVLCRAAANENS